MPIHVVVTRDYDHLSEQAFAVLQADLRERLRHKPEYLLGLATGNSPVGLYKHLARAADTGAFDPSRVRTFNLDEYVGLPGENAQQRTLHPASYSYFMTAELFGLVGRKFKETNVPYGCLIDQQELMTELRAHPRDWREVGGDSGRAILLRAKPKSGYLDWVRREVLQAYAKKIRRAGGIDLQVIGVGGRGHVAFHESGIPWRAGGVLLVKLDDNTVFNAVADGHFPSADDVPRFAVTMSTALVFEARRVLLLAYGERKQEPLYRALLGRPTPDVPISYAQTYAAGGGDLVVVVDRIAGEPLLRERQALKKRGVMLVDRRAGRAKHRVADLRFCRRLDAAGYLCR